MSGPSKQTPPIAPAAPLAIQDAVHTGRHTLILSGELDIASTPELEAAVSGLCAGDVEAITLDLSNVSFMDASGLQAILATRWLCETNACDFALIQGPRQVQELFDFCGLLDVLPFRDA
ncbi:MAG TPA: STAS domain-containing protein [Solirubrobacteraceae bacterium]|jgi:anti-anti-sigma factor|nr:STAS domain-containing protein [Solirubrobacteraceae bacterium]